MRAQDDGVFVIQREALRGAVYAAMVAGVGSVFHTVQAEAAIGVIAGEFGDGSADGEM